MAAAMKKSAETQPSKKPTKRSFFDRITSHWLETNERRWQRVPTLLRYDPKIFLSFIAIGCLISGVTVATLDLALLHEMSGLLATRPIDVYAFIIAVSFLVGGAIFFYPFLLINHRMQVYLEEETERLNAKYREGLQQFQIEKGKKDIAEDAPWGEYKQILENMSRQNPDYQDFVYLYTTSLQIEYQKNEEINRAIDAHEQTYEEIKKDILRELIYATSWENLEDSAYDLGSYLMPVTYCMAAVALGFITLALIPLLGTSTIMIGDASINLIWAVGGFIGAYLYSFLPFFQRCTRRDMPPRAFLHYALNIFLGITGIALFGNLFLGSVPGSATQLAVAAILGSVPFFAMAEARKRGLKIANFKLAKTEIGRENVCAISGIDYEYADRLHEEGVMNIQNLAFADVENLSKRTRLNRDMLFDWKDQAILMLLTGDVETDCMKKPNGGT